MTDTNTVTREERMVYAHQLGVRDYHAGLPMVHAIVMAGEDERIAYEAGYRAAMRRYRAPPWARRANT